MIVTRDMVEEIEPIEDSVLSEAMDILACEDNGWLVIVDKTKIEDE